LYPSPNNSAFRRTFIYLVNKDGTVDKNYHPINYQITAFIYYGLTTFGTIGLGDFYAVSETEMVLSILLLFSGYLIFSLLMGILKWEL
jgi:hypothetical protein